MVARLRTSIERGINYYVPRMQSSGQNMSRINAFSLGSPAAAAAGAVQAAAFDAVNKAAGAKTYLTTEWVADTPYGRTITPVLSGDPGASNAQFEVCGYDYLGQLMAQVFNATSGAATLTPTTSSKAFYRVTHVINRLDTTNAVTLAIGTGGLIGLPYKFAGEFEWASESGTARTQAQLETSSTLPVLTDPQTLATGDPRGLYTPGTFGVPIVVGLIPDPSYNTAGNGGLHGIRHFAPSDF